MKLPGGPDREQILAMSFVAYVMAQENCDIDTAQTRVREMYSLAALAREVCAEMGLDGLESLIQ